MLLQFIKAFWLPVALIVFNEPVAFFLSKPINVAGVGFALAFIIAVYIYRRGRASLSQSEIDGRNDGIDHGARRVGIYFLLLIPMVGFLYFTNPQNYTDRRALPQRQQQGQTQPQSNGETLYYNPETGGLQKDPPPWAQQQPQDAPGVKRYRYDPETGELIPLWSMPSPEAQKNPDQWQYEESLVVPDLIPEDRCVRATYIDPALKEERGFRIEWWQPPITDFMARWLDERRQDGRLVLTFCDEGEA